MKPLLRLTWVETKLFFREPLSLLFTFAFPFFVLFILAGVFGNEPEVDDEGNEVWRGVGPTDYYVPAYVGLIISAIGLISLPVHLANYRERGILRRFHASALPVWVLFGAQLAVSMAVAIVGAVSITVAAIIAYGTDPPEQIFLALVAFVIAVMSFVAIGMLLGALLPTARTAQGAGLILFFLMMFSGGAGPPREVLGDSMQKVGGALPLTHVILLLQDPWLGFGWHTSASLVVAGFLIAATALTVLLFRWD